MANVTLMGASYSDVPAVTLPQTGGGTATFTDVSPTTAVDADVASGKIYFKADGSQSTGTGSGGGGGGLVYESGTYTPTDDIRSPTISFTNTHTDVPIFVMLTDASESNVTNNSMGAWFIVNWYSAFGSTYKHSTGERYARVAFGYASSSELKWAGTDITSTTGGTQLAELPYWITTTSFKPYSGSTTRYWRSGRTYKWIAVWAPTT